MQTELFNDSKKKPHPSEGKPLFAGGPGWVVRVDDFTREEFEHWIKVMRLARDIASGKKNIQEILE